MMSGVIKPLSAGLPSALSFLTERSCFSLAAAGEPATAARPRPGSNDARRPANALRLNRLENIFISPLVGFCHSFQEFSLAQSKRDFSLRAGHAAGSSVEVTG